MGPDQDLFFAKPFLRKKCLKHFRKIVFSQFFRKQKNPIFPKIRSTEPGTAEPSRSEHERSWREVSGGGGGE